MLHEHIEQSLESPSDVTVLKPNENDHQATTCMKLLTEVCSLFVIYINEMAVVNIQNSLQEDLY